MKVPLSFPKKQKMFDQYTVQVEFQVAKSHMHLPTAHCPTSAR